MYQVLRRIFGGVDKHDILGPETPPVVEPLRGRFSAFSPSVGPLRSLLLFRRPMYFLWRPSCHSVASHVPRRSPLLTSHTFRRTHALLRAHDKQQYGSGRGQHWPEHAVRHNIGGRSLYVLDAMPHSLKLIPPKNTTLDSLVQRLANPRLQRDDVAIRGRLRNVQHACGT